METLPFKESTKALLRPRQTVSMKEERDRLHNTLNGPDFIQAQIQDRGIMMKQLREVTKMIDTQSPKGYVGPELDQAIKRSKELKEKFLPSMPTHAEMRRNPPGATDKHRRWLKDHKEEVLEYKNIQLNLHQSGALPQFLPDSCDVANIELLRPSGGAQELNMVNAQIPGTEYHMDYIPSSVVFTDSDIEKIKDFDPELLKILALIPAETREKIKTVLSGNYEPTLTADAATNTDVPHTKTTCSQEGGCKREVDVEGEKCWQHKEKN